MACSSHPHIEDVLDVPDVLFARRELDAVVGQPSPALPGMPPADR
jgi:hypothetical protein